MRLLKSWQGLTIFWKIYLLTVLLVTSLISTVEIVAENYLEPPLSKLTEISTAGQEAIFWIITIFLSALLFAHILAGYLNRKFGTVSGATEQIAKGNLNIRLDIENPNDPFGKMAANFNNMAAEIQRLLDSERRLLADISHELRSPLTRMALALELANRNYPPESEQYLERMQIEIDRMSELVTILLQHGRNTLNYKQQAENINLSQLLQNIATDVTFQAETENKQVVYQIPQKIFVRGNAVQLHNMINNVASNALNYSPAGEKIEITAYCDEEDIFISVKDHGPGVPEAHLEDIFRAFYRIDSSRARESGGVGLGLAIAKQVAISHGGDICAINCHPGLCVTINIPLAKQP